MPPAPRTEAPAECLVVDPAAGKPTWAVECVDGMACRWRRWQPGAQAVGAHSAFSEPGGVAVVEGRPSGFGDHSNVVKLLGKHKAATKLAEARGEIVGACKAAGAEVVIVTPAQWRGAFKISHGDEKSLRQLVRLWAASDLPIAAMAREATNDDKRAALAIWWACATAWRWA
jgi:hypothetical protein